MANKTIALLSLSILSLVLALSMVSAAVVGDYSFTSDGDATNINSNINLGTLTAGAGVGAIAYGSNGAYADSWENSSDLTSDDYFQITISPKTNYNLTLTNIDFGVKTTATGPTDYKVKWSKNSDFSSSTLLGTYTTNTSGTSETMSSSIFVDEGETLYLRWFAYNASGSAGNFYITDDSLHLEGTVTEIPQVDFCNSQSNQGDLEVKIEDIKVISGFGEDDEWMPLDEIEVEVSVENKGDWDIEDIELEWGLYDESENEWIIEMTDEDDFDLDENDDTTLTFNFILNEKILDVDFDELENYDDVILVVRASGQIDDSDSSYDGDETCDIDSDPIKLIQEKDFVIVGDIEVSESASCGSDVAIDAKVWNIGSDDQDDVVVTIYDDLLGMIAEIEVGDIDAYDSETISTIYSVPKDANEGTYYITFKVFDEDGDVYESDEDQDSKVRKRFVIEGSCSSTPEAVISAELVSEKAVAGKELVIKTTITNANDNQETFTISTTGNSEWAELVGTSPSVVALNAGESKEVTLTFNVLKGISGDKSFTFQATNADGEAVTQGIQVSVEEAKGLAGITGNVIGGDNMYLWIIGVLNVVLVVVIILVAIRIAKN